MKSAKGKIPSSGGPVKARKAAVQTGKKPREKDPVEVGWGRECVCVCVCERMKERNRENYNITDLLFLDFSYY